MREGAQPGSPAEDITPPDFNVRTLVHEYGGGAFTVKADNIVFSNYADQRLYKQSLNGGTCLQSLTLVVNSAPATIWWLCLPCTVVFASPKP